VGAPFPSEAVAAEVTATLGSVEMLGRYRDATGAIVVRLPGGARTAGLPQRAAGYPVRYLASQLTGGEMRAATEEVIAIAAGKAGFTIGYDSRLDKVLVTGYFPDATLMRQVAAVRGVELHPLPRYVLTDAEWQAQNDAFTATAPSILGRWADFPYDHSPRPLILADSSLHRGLRRRIPHSDPDHRATVETSSPVPDNVLRRLTHGGADRPLPHPLRGTRATAWFMTDRGQAELPVWQLELAEGPCTVLDPDLPIWWPHTGEQWTLAMRCTSARIEPDDLTVHLNAPGGDATEFIDVEIHETTSAVLAKPITRERAGPHTAVGLHRKMTTVLPHPLGDRVLIDERGAPYIVVPVGSSLRPRWWPDPPNVPPQG
jgi:hypothetical protein